ncbi:MAG: nickel insertion protein, partial [Thermoguttaceae bacterium]
MATRPNLLRATLYETDTQTNGDSCPYVAETLYELETNIDDATGERLATAAAALFRIGALDVWFEPIQMKKGRPASRFCALVSESERQEALDAFFRHSGTFGVRETPKRRYSLFRRWQDVQTEWGSIRVKVGETRHGAILTVAPEFDDVVAVAEANNLTFEHVYRETLLAYNSLK